MSYFDAFKTAPAARVQPQEEIVIEEESSDDEMESLAEQRRRSKAISVQAAVRRSLPVGARQKAPESPFASMMALSELAVMLKEVTSAPPVEQSTNHRILQEIKAANLLPTSGTTDAPRKLDRPSTPKTSRPTSAHSQSETSWQMPRKPTKPAATRQRSFESNAAQCCEVFCMDMIDVTEDSPTNNATIRESSLARGYDALGAQHFSLDDGGDTYLGGTKNRASSIARGYDALKGSLESLPSQPASLEGELPPVRPPSRSSKGRTSRSPVARQPLHRASSGPSAMELDLGLSSDVAPRRRSDYSQARALDEEATKPPMPVSKPPLPMSKPPLPVSKPLLSECSSPSLGKHRVMKVASKHSTSSSLPPMLGAKGVADSSYRRKSGLTMKTSSSKSAFWDLPSHRPPMTSCM